MQRSWPSCDALESLSPISAISWPTHHRETLDGWDRSQTVEVHRRRQALAESVAGSGVSATPTRGATMAEIRPVEDRDELRQVFDLLGAEVAERIDASDFRYGDLAPTERLAVRWRPAADRLKTEPPLAGPGLSPQTVVLTPHSLCGGGLRQHIHAAK